MRKLHTFTFLFALLCACAPAEKEQTVPSSNEKASEKAATLLEIDDLLAMNDASVKLIDVRPADAYAQGHLPKAMQVYRNDIEDLANPVKGMMATKAQMEALLSKLGIQPSDLVVIYDGKGNPDASRLWWILDVYGHKRKALLNGGLLAWKARGLALSQENTVAQASNYRFEGQGRTDRYASIEDVKNALSDTNYVLLDARTIEEYTGKEEIGQYKRVGRIPKSIFLSHESNIAFERQGKFRSVEELKELYKGIDPSKKIICYCKSGVRSAMSTYVLSEILGYKDVRNYDGSWLEWNMHEELPIER